MSFSEAIEDLLGYKVNDEYIKEIEGRIAGLKDRWPAHTVPPSMWQELEDLEAELETAKKDEFIKG